MINEIKNKSINLMAKIISTDILISKQINNSTDELKLLQVQIADETGTLRVYLKNEQIKKVKLGKEYIFRNLKIDVINNVLVLICDENSIIFSTPHDYIKISSSAIFDNDFSRVKICCLSNDIVNN